MSLPTTLATTSTSARSRDTLDSHGTSHGDSPSVRANIELIKTKRKYEHEVYKNLNDAAGVDSQRKLYEL